MSEATKGRKELASPICSRCGGEGWSWEYAHPLVGMDMKWRKCHCPKGETEPKPKGKPNEH